MLGIGTLLARRAARKRAIFRYHDGKRTRWADPLVIDARLETAGGENWQETVLQVFQLSRPAPQGLSGAVAEERKAALRRETGKLLTMIRYAFNIEPLNEDGDGLTEVETVETMTAYLMFREELATAARPLAG